MKINQSTTWLACLAVLFLSACEPTGQTQTTGTQTTNVQTTKAQTEHVSSEHEQSNAHHTHQVSQVLPEYVFKASGSPQQQVIEAQDKAIAEQKLLLVVMGAQWCHDSTGLAAKFSTQPMQKVLNERFETVFVDVGYYQDLRPITERFGYAGYYATPLVMVIEPNSSKLLNVQSLVRFNHADSIPFDEIVKYFSVIANSQEQTSVLADNAEVNAFAKQQTDRLFKGFAKLRPLFKGAIEGELTDYSDLEPLSEEIYQFRIQLQSDINQLNKQAIKHGQLGLKHELNFPVYGPFSWES